MNQRLLNQKEATEFLGYSKNSNILALMRMPKNKNKYEFVPRYIEMNGVIRYPLDWLEADLAKFKTAKLK